MSHIVFVLNAYLPESDANITCVNNVIAALNDDGHKISCVCGTSEKIDIDTIDGVRIFRVPHIAFNYKYEKLNNKFIKAIYKIVHLIKSIIIMPIFPNVEPLFSKKLFRKLEDINSECKIDCAIGVFRPFASIDAVIKFKECHPDIKVVGYYLDVLKGAIKPMGIPLCIYNYICDQKEKRIFPKFDLVLMAESGRMFYDKKTGFSELDNIEYVNFPTLVFKDIKVSVSKSKKISFVYAGYMDRIYRNPIPIIMSVIELRKKIPDIQLHLYGTSNLDNEIKEYEEKNPDLIFYHGNVKKEDAVRAVYAADYLISIGNDIANIVPSKVFELFASGKPIIHFSNPELDSTQGLFEKYPDAVVIDKKISPEDAADKIYEYLQKEHSQVDKDYLLTTFYTATPEAVASKIVGEINVYE